MSELLAELRAVRAELRGLRRENELLAADNLRLRTENEELRVQLAVRDARIAELEKKLGPGSGGRGSPPPARTPSGKPRGGQKGHKGRGRTLPATVDEEVFHALHNCPHCEKPVVPANDVDTHLEREVVPRRVITRRHTIQRGWCPCCKKVVRAPTPDLLPRTAYGPGVHAALATLSCAAGCSLGNLQSFASEHWGLALGSGQLFAMLQRCAAALMPCFELLLTTLTQAPTLHSDKTGWRVEGERAALWVFSAHGPTVYWIDPSGSGWVPRLVIGETFEGVVNTDGEEVWQRVRTAGRQRCLAHPLRTARDLLRLRGDEHEIQWMMGDLQRHLQWVIGLHGRRSDLKASTWAQYSWRARRDLLALARIPWSDADCVRMSKRIEAEIDEWLLFLTDPSEQVEPTNNEAERELRPAVIDRKKKQQSRGLAGVFQMMVLRSVERTCRNLGIAFEQVVVAATLAHAREGPAAKAPTAFQEALKAWQVKRPSSAQRQGAPVQPAPSQD